MRSILALALAALAAAVGCGGGNPAPATAPGSSGDPSERTETPDVTLDPELREPFALIGRQLTVAARDRLAAYQDQHPDNGQAEFLVGLSYHREKRYALARPHFARAIELSPDYHPAYHFLGWCLYYLGEPVEARRAFERHLEHLPDEGDSHFGIGLIDLDQDSLDAAEQRFLNAIEVQADNPRRRRVVAKAHARLADVYLRRDELQRARVELQRATRMWPEHYAAFYKLSRVLTRLGEQDEAEEAFRQYRLWQERVRPSVRGVPERDS